MDIPIKRSTHKKPIPTGGGLVFFIVSFLGSIIYYFFYQNHEIITLIPAITLLLEIISFKDDISNVSINYRITLHGLTSFIFVYFTNLNLLNFNPYLNIIIFLFLILISTSIINFFNFIDGIDGLLSGTFIIILISSIIILKINNPIIYLILGSIIYFFIINKHPAKIFMGDVGSIFLGSVFSCLVFQSQDMYTFLALLLLGTPIFLIA